MKKLVLILFAIATSTAFTQAQTCNADQQFAGFSDGFYPTQMPDMVAGQPYNVTVTIRTPSDTCIVFSGFNLCLYLQAARILTIDGLPGGFTFTPNYNGIAGGLNAWVNTGGTPYWTPVLGCLTLSASAAAVDAAIAANSGDTQLHYTYQLDTYMKNIDSLPPILQGYTWGSEIGLNIPYDVNGGGTGNPTNPTSCATLNYQGNPTSFAGLLPTAGTFDLNVTAPANCNWALAGGDTWFTYSPSSGTGDGTISFSYDANTTGEGRFAILDFGGDLYTISQMADTCAMSITYDTTVFDPLGGIMVLDIIFSDPNCYWNLVTRSVCEGVDVNPMSGTGSTQVTVTFAPNTTNTPRQCELNFGNGNVVTLNQQAGTVGIQEDKTTLFTLYPNPANDLVTIATNNITGKEVLSIYTVAGQLLSQTQITSTKQQINTTDLANGIYVFTVQNAKGIAGRKKVVISR